MTGRIAIVIALASIASDAGAQTAEHEGMLVGAGGVCLDVASGVVGAAVITGPCTGARRQRWSQYYGDENDLWHSESHLCPGRGGGNAMRVALHDRDVICDARYDDAAHVVRVGSSCIRPGARPGDAVSLAPCDGSPDQRWEMR